jgi:APA family basic amino acid/polyamine antiporter
MSDHAESNPTPRLLGPWPATAIVAGTMLGVGIFIGPPQVAAAAGGVAPFFLLWLAGAAAALCGALSVAELSAMVPKDGGHYVYLRRAYGPGVGFAAGWLETLAVMPGSIAAIALALGQFQLPALFGERAAAPFVVGGVEVSAPFVWATLVVLALTTVNWLGIVLTGRTQVLLTSAPVLVLFVAAVVLLFAGVGPPRGPAAPAAMAGGGLAAAYLPVFFAYAGWDAAIYVGGEVKDPGRTLPRALLGGTLVVTVLYAVLCVFYLRVFTLEGLAAAGEAGSASAEALFGRVGIVAVTSLILAAVLGSLNAQVLQGSRISYAMALDGELPRAFARLDPGRKTPAVALWVQAAWTIALMATNRVDQLVAYTSTAMLIAGSLSAMSVVVFRFRDPDAPRPYRAWLYPLPPVLFAVSSLVVLAILARNGDPSVLFAIGWFVGAYVVYRLFLARRRVTAPPPAGP